MNPLFEQMPTSVFERMSLAATEHGAVNLGQGFPDFGWPPEILAQAAEALLHQSNQYPPSRGLPRLREAVADHYRRHQGLALGSDHVVVTSGATEALAAAILALVEPGDEAIIFAPAYDAYAPLVRRAGGVVREVKLAAPGWRIEEQAVEAAVSDRTRVIIVNNPHNPTGRLFGRDELQAIAAVAQRHDLIVITDEVWEHLLLGSEPFVSMAALPGMAERTIKCGSAGKIFSLTGWKIGWLVAPPGLARVLTRAHQYLAFASPPNLQQAVAWGLAEGDAWLAPMRARFARGRDRLAAGLAAAGYAVLPSEATYFCCVDLAASGLAPDDEAFAQAAVEQAGVAVIPLSPFYEEAPERGFVRLCFGKQDATLDAGIAAMTKARELAR
ncbi:aminotransferase [Sphingomonas ginkgonis]|uniref:Aminotransferase n=1 Tax=Sphingomonas ginkgonis TaxID=2315330 RepID=A0A429V9S8_9SPHN|nr:aminotransferase [Sphingomonas ginkgonis]RST30694.1 aminotransferase [Sphingomonas ginkgonis]